MSVHTDYILLTQVYLHKKKDKRKLIFTHFQIIFLEYIHISHSVDFSSGTTKSASSVFVDKKYNYVLSYYVVT